MYFCMYVYNNSVRVNVACSYLDLINFAFTYSIEVLSRLFLQFLISSILIYSEQLGWKSSFTQAK